MEVETIGAKMKGFKLTSFSRKPKTIRLFLAWKLNKKNLSKQKTLYEIFVTVSQIRAVEKFFLHLPYVQKIESAQKLWKKITVFVLCSQKET